MHSEAKYGYCPKCGGIGTTRMLGDDACINGHKYPTSAALSTPEPVETFEPEAVVALGDDAVLADVAKAHEPLTLVRAHVARAVASVQKDPAPVMAISVVSVGDTIEDQMIVYSPGGRAANNARVTLKRLQMATRQLRQLIDQGKFD